MEKTNKYKIKVLEKALKILELFDERGKELTATEIHSFLNFNKASTFRILANLEHADFLEKNPETLKYKLGFKIFILGSLAESHSTIRKISRPFLEKLNDECGETVHLAVLQKGKALYLDKIEGKQTIRVITRVGMKLPAHCSGVGKMLLSALSINALDEIASKDGLQRFTANTIVDIEKLKRELSRNRRQGFAIDNEEIEEGLKCVAAPLIGKEGKVLAAISISAPSTRFDNNESSYISMITKTAKKISQAIYKQERVNYLVP